MAEVKRYSISELRELGRNVEGVVRPPLEMPAEVAVPMPAMPTVKKARKRVAPTALDAPAPAAVASPSGRAAQARAPAAAPPRPKVTFQLDEAMQAQLAAVRELVERTGMSCEDIILAGADESPPPLLLSDLRPTAAPFQPSRLNPTAIPFRPLPDPP
eukprot:Hpha_TRINITY_DN10792_c0_g1::TRINITY_DN10792_c0_g1_i1::g.43662::m.43662